MGKIENGGAGRLSEEIILEAIGRMEKIPTAKGIAVELRRGGHFDIALDMLKPEGIYRRDVRIYMAIRAKTLEMLEKMPYEDLFKYINRIGFNAGLPAETMMLINGRINDKLLSVIKNMEDFPSGKKVEERLLKEGIKYSERNILHRIEQNHGMRVAVEEKAGEIIDRMTDEEIFKNASERRFSGIRNTVRNRIMDRLDRIVLGVIQNWNMKDGIPTYKGVLLHLHEKRIGDGTGVALKRLRKSQKLSEALKKKCLEWIGDTPESVPAGMLNMKNMKFPGSVDLKIRERITDALKKAIGESEDGNMESIGAEFRKSAIVNYSASTIRDKIMHDKDLVAEYVKKHGSGFLEKSMRSDRWHSEAVDLVLNMKIRKFKVFREAIALLESGFLDGPMLEISNYNRVFLKASEEIDDWMPPEGYFAPLPAVIGNGIVGAKSFFSLVVFPQTLHLTGSLEKAIGEASGALRDGGRMIATLPEGYHFGSSSLSIISEKHKLLKMNSWKLHAKMNPETLELLKYNSRAIKTAESISEMIIFKKCVRDGESFAREQTCEIEVSKENGNRSVRKVPHGNELAVAPEEIAGTISYVFSRKMTEREEKNGTRSKFLVYDQGRVVGAFNLAAGREAEITYENIVNNDRRGLGEAEIKETRALLKTTLEIGNVRLGMREGFVTLAGRKDIERIIFQGAKTKISNT